MGEISDLGRAYLRDFVTDGVPSSGQHRPDKEDGRLTFDTIDAALSSALSGVIIGDAVVYETRSGLFADLLHDAGTLGVVWGDGTAAYNGIYVKAGSSGAGSWSLTDLALPSSFVADLAEIEADLDAEIVNRAAADIQNITSIGGTADAITGTVSGTDASGRLYLLHATAANTGAVTLALNGGAALPILDAGNQTITAANAIKSGRRYILRNYSNTTYRIVNSVISDQEFEDATADLSESLDTLQTETEVARGGYSSLNDRLTTFDAAAVMAETIDAPAPGTAWSLTGRNDQVLAWLDGNGKLVNPAAARGVVPGTPHTAFAKTHLTAKVADDAEFGSFYTFADDTDYPIMWSNRGQYPYGPLVELDGAVAVPAPLLKDAVGRASSYAIYPLPPGTKKLTTGTALEFIVQWGQSLSVFSGSGGLAGQAWKAFVEWGGTNVATQLKMLNGGLVQPGMSGDSAVNGAQQASITNAVDQGYDTQSLYNASGVLTGDSGFVYSSSAGIAHLIRRALGADGLKFEKSVGFVTLGVGGQSIEYFKTTADGGTSDWFANVFEATLANIVTAAGSYSEITIPHTPLEQGEADSQDMDKATYRGHLDEAVAAVQAAVVSATSQSDDPVVSQTQIGNALLSTGATTTGRPLWEVSDVALAILEKGLSTDSADLEYICVGPRYDLTFISISHLDHFGYLHSQERVAYALNEDARLRAEGVQEKWFPAHATAVTLETIDDRPFVVVECFVPFPPLRVETLLLPKKPNFGFHFRGGSNTPTIVDCYIGPRGDKVYLELNTAWTGTSRVFGVAAKAQEGRQGWLTDDEGPASPWQHEGMGCNVCDSAPWSSVATGRRLPNFLCSSLHNIAD